MALQSSGVIALSEVQTEFGGASPTSLSEYYRGGDNVPSAVADVPASGEIKFSDFYSTSNVSDIVYHVVGGGGGGGGAGGGSGGAGGSASISSSAFSTVSAYGGAGGAGPAQGGGFGSAAAGQYNTGTLASIDPGTVITVTVGAGGAGGAGYQNSASKAGGAGASAFVRLTIGGTNYDFTSSGTHTV